MSLYRGLKRVIVLALLVQPFHLALGASDCLKQAYESLEVTSQIGSSGLGQVKVVRNGIEATYARTKRDLNHMQMEFPRLFSESALPSQDSKVLDIGMGSGAFVEDLRKKGVDAVGVDIVLTEDQKTEGHSKYFIEADAAKLPFPDNTFDSTYSIWSVFSYAVDNYWKDQGVFFQNCVLEALRVTKKGGAIRLAPSSQELMQYLNYFEAKYPGHIQVIEVDSSYAYGSLKIIKLH